jgi:hypothetical protein
MASASDEDCCELGGGLWGSDDEIAQYEVQRKEARRVPPIASFNDVILLGSTLPPASALLFKRDGGSKQAEEQGRFREMRVVVLALSRLHFQPPGSLEQVAQALDLMTRAAQLLRHSGGQRQGVWRQAMDLEGLNDSVFLPLLSAGDENLVECTNAVLSLSRGLGATFRTVTLDRGTRTGREPLVISLKETGRVGVGVGGLLWDGAVLLSRRLWAGLGPYSWEGHEWAGSRVLEVACGACALPAITTAHLGAAEVVVTDYLGDLINAALTNCRENTVAQGNDVFWCILR